MPTPMSPFSQTYHLVMDPDGQGEARTIEFEASGADAALYVAERQCRGRTVELFENQRSLGRLKCKQPGGYWILSGSRSD